MAITPIIYDFVVDIRNDSNFFIAKAPQGDARARFLDITVTDNGAYYELPTSDVTYIVSGTNAGGALIYNSCTLSNNKIRVPLTNVMLGVAGVSKYQLKIYATDGTDTVLSCFDFNIMVEESAFNVNVLTTSNEFTALTNLISNIASANKWILGEGEPDDDIGTFSDLYMDTLTADVYQKGETAWVWQCKLGSQTFFAYATSSTGENFSLTYSSSKTYLGICNEQTSTQPTTIIAQRSQC